MIRCLAPAPAVDVTYVVDRVRPGEIHRPSQVLRRPGGKAFNVARTVGCLGGTPLVVGPVGGLSGDWIVDAAAAEGIDFDAVLVIGHESRTCVSVCTVEGGPPTDFYETSHAVGPAHWREFVARVAGSLAPLTVLSGSLPPDVDVGQLEELVRVIRPASHPGRLLVDLGGPVAAAWLATAPAPDVLKVNLAEAAELTGLPQPPEADVVEAHHLAAKLATTSGAQLVVVTRGAAGALSVDATGAALVISSPPRGAHPVGSGDAFMGALAVGLAGTREPMRVSDPTIVRLLQTATAAAADNASRLGAGTVDPQVVRRVAQRVRVDPLG